MKQITIIVLMLFVSVSIYSQNNRKSYIYNKNKVHGVTKYKKVEFPWQKGKKKYKLKVIRDTIYIYDTVYITKEVVKFTYVNNDNYNFDNATDSIVIDDNIEIDDIATVIPEYYISPVVKEQYTPYVKQPKPIKKKKEKKEKVKKQRDKSCKTRFYLGVNVGYPSSVGGDIWLSFNRFNIGLGFQHFIHDRQSYTVSSFYGYDRTYNVFMAYDVAKFKLGIGLQMMPVNRYLKDNNEVSNLGHSLTNYGPNLFVHYQITKVFGFYSKLSYYPKFCVNRVQGQLGINFKICM